MKGCLSRNRLWLNDNLQWQSHSCVGKGSQIPSFSYRFWCLGNMLFPSELSGSIMLSFVFSYPAIFYFLKPFLKGKILRSSERGVNSILTTILRFWPTSWRDRIFCLVASDSARRQDHFQKKICPKRTFPSNFVKLVSKILYLFLAETRICASLGSRMKFKTLCYPVFGRHKNTALPSFWFILIASNASIVCPINK